LPWLSLALLLAMMLVVCVEDCDAKSKKTKKKKAGSTPKSPEKDDEEETKSKPKKPWNKMTKADWDRLEQEAEGPGEPFKMPEPPNVAFDPQNPQAFMEASKKGKPAMMFATLNKIKDEKTGKMRERDKPETEEVAFRHKSLMQSGHLDATPYVIDPNKILWTVHDGSKGFEVKNFLMLQEEVEEFEWDQQKETKASWRSKNPEL